MAEATIILPPPSATNPIPSLPAALRLDNQEQLQSLLCHNPLATTTSSSLSSSSLSFTQLLVFESDALRTLLLRQVLQDPQQSMLGSSSTSSSTSATSSTATKQTKKNWQPHLQFSYPKILQGNIVGTRLLHPHHQGSHPPNASSIMTSSRIHSTLQGAEVRLEDNSRLLDTDPDTTTTTATTSTSTTSTTSTTNPLDTRQHVDVITYFLRPWELQSTQAVAYWIRHWNKKKPNVHHRLVYLPQITALVRQVLMDLGLTATAASNHYNMTIHHHHHHHQSHSHNNKISIQALQLDVFPIDSDVLSLEYHTSWSETICSTPSPLITTCARALLKLQDITGNIPRFQSMGPLAEEVLTKALHQQVDEYLVEQKRERTSTTTSGGGGGDGNLNVVYEPEEDDAVPDKALAMMLIDRQVDMVTPMVTPLTYEGLLDEIVGIQTGFIKVDVQTINPDEDNDEKNKNKNKNNNNALDPTRLTKRDERKSTEAKHKTPPELVSLAVTEADSLYAEVRNQHVEQFGSFLQNQALALKESHANFTNKETKKDLTEIHQFVKNIPMFTQNLRTLTNHIHLAERIQAHTEQTSFREQWQTERSMIEGEICYDQLEEWIASGYPPFIVLRMLCLQSICAGGLKSSRYETFRTQLVQVYGYEFLPILHQVERLGWIRRRDTLWMDAASSAFQVLRKSLILIHAEVDTVDPDDVAYVSSGYAPLTVRIVQSAMQGWRDKTDVLQQLPGQLVDVQPTQPPQDLASTLKQQRTALPSLGAYAETLKRKSVGNHHQKPTLLVFFLGGVTFMEIAALRFLSKRTSFPYHVIIVTTQIMNGSTLLQELQ